MWQGLLERYLPDARGAGRAWAFDTRRDGGGMQIAKLLLDEFDVLVLPSGMRGESFTLLPCVLTSEQSAESALEAIVAAARRLLA